MQQLSNPLLSIELDQGYAEVYQYIKEYWIALSLLLMAILRKQLVYCAWSLLFVYLLMDDALQIHEKVGGTLANRFELPGAFRLQPKDFGEAGVSLFFGAILFLLIGMAYFRADERGKEISKYLFLLVVIMASFGVVVDMVHAIIPWGYTVSGVNVKSLFGLIEDGGEMLIMSGIMWYVFSLEFTSREPVNAPGHG